MTVKEIKLQALRLMFADSDIDFSVSEYDSGVLNANANTRDKLVRMDDSIKRGIDIYNTLVEQETGIKELGLVASGGVYANTVDISSETTMQYVTRVDIFLYQTIEEVTELVHSKNQVNYVYDGVNKKIYFQDVDYAKYYNEYDIYSVVVRVWYKIVKANIAGNNDNENLDTLRIPSDVQRMLPLYVKGELYEEDEYAIAQAAKQEFNRFLGTIRQPFNKVQTKVKRASVFNK
jgi:hypothetical protein